MNEMIKLALGAVVLFFGLASLVVSVLIARWSWQWRQRQREHTAMATKSEEMRRDFEEQQKRVDAELRKPF